MKENIQSAPDSLNNISTDSLEIQLNEFLDLNLNNPIDIPLANFLLNLILTIIFTLLISFIYNKYGNSLSNRKSFGNNYPLIGIATFLIITIIKSSLALSLGLVGALSIVRFRSAIKEPEELAYIFFTIAVALGFGANQTYITIIGFIVFSIFIIFKKSNINNDNEDLIKFIIIETSQDPDTIINLLKPNVNQLSIRRLESKDNLNEYIFNAELISFNKLDDIRKKLLSNDKKASLIIMDQSGLNNVWLK